MRALPDEAEVSRALHDIYVPGAETRLRKEESVKVRELVPLLAEIDSVLRRAARDRELLLVDAAAGRGYVSLLCTRLLSAGRRLRWVVIEREPRRARACADLSGGAFDVRCADVSDPAAWPAKPDLVVALHSCGPSADAVIERAAAAEARALLLVPCCVSKTVAGHAPASAAADALGITRQSPVRRRFLESVIASRRTLQLEALGYQTEVVEFCPASITPQNLLWRARRTANPARMRRAAAQLSGAA